MVGIEGMKDNLFDVVGIYRGLILSATTIVVLWVIYRLTTKGVKRYLTSRLPKPDDVQQFMLVWRYGWMGLVVAFGLIAFSGSLSNIGLSAAFLGMILGWSLQAPVTGIAAWLMVIVKRPFRIGDRIIIAGITGDVVDINLTHVLLNQVGGTIGGEEKSNRAVLVPNATLFQQVIYNYTLEGFEKTEENENTASYLLDEVVIMITFRSDFDEAERVLIQAAQEVTQSIVAETGQEPFIRAEIFEHGVRIRLRYNTLAKDRQRISSEICRVVIREFKRNDKVEFCVPHSQILYRYNPDGAPPVDQTRLSETFGQ